MKPKPFIKGMTERAAAVDAPDVVNNIIRIRRSLRKKIPRRIF
jgi:hypothetical protein